MGKLHPLLLLMPLFLAACTHDVSRHSPFAALLGHPVTTRVPLQLAEPNIELARENKCYLAGSISGYPLVGTIPAGHPVLFQKDKCYNGLDSSEEYLTGTVEFRGKTYPFAYFITAWDLETNAEAESDVWKPLRYDFVLPDKIGKP